MEDGPVLAIDAVDLRLEEGRHPLEMLAAGEIDAAWHARLAQGLRLHDGEVVLATGLAVEQGRVSGHCRRIRYAGLLHFLDLPDAAASATPYRHLFAWPAIIGGDGRAIMGRMAAHTANAGRIYFPAGSLDTGDFRDGRADLDANMAREVREETGLDLARAAPDPGYLLLPAGKLALVMRIFRYREAAEDLAGEARAHLARGADDELDAILSFAPGQTDAAMAPLARRFMRWLAR
jgi:8-oxo-dGTP pyrophosphatase MutT (NUDIX family)